MIGHNGYNSCLKCVTEGEYSHTFKTMIFPEIDANLRNDEDFRSRVYEGHHKFDSILEEIAGLDMVNDFPIGDSLHLIDLGITKRLLNGWKSGTLNNHNAKWSGKQLDDISKFLKTCKLPREFQRPVRGLEHLPRWKGTELRTFLLYLSVIVLKKFFSSEDVIDHFLNFYCAINICIRPNQNMQNLEVARNLITDFLKGVKVLYGEQLFCSNIHNLSHLVNDVKRFGPLGTFDAYPFESKLFGLKRLIRNGKLPLAQVARRICEIQANTSNRKSHKPTSKKSPVLKRRNFNVSLMNAPLNSLIQNDSELYSFVDMTDFCIDTQSNVDQWIFTRSLKIISVSYITKHASSNDISLIGNSLVNLSDLFLKPIVSSSLYIYGSDMECTSDLQVFPLDEIVCKMVKIDCQDVALPKSVFFPLIHTLK